MEILLSKFLKGDRVAQLIIEKILKPKIKIVDEFTHQVERNPQGFGTSGMKFFEK